MGDRNPIRDRTLILRVLVPGLEARLREKMEEVAAEADGNNNNANKSSNTPSNSRGGGHSSSSNNNNNSNDSSSKDILLELEGVKCEPVVDYGSSRGGGVDNGDDMYYSVWNFHCDGGIYPARLVNLPCPVELHKTHDHVMYYKCTDVAQMLIVYEDQTALEEDRVSSSSGGKLDGFPSYYPHGLTPPMKNVVQRRFAACEHNSVAPPRAQVTHVENELIDLMQKISKESGGGGGGGAASKRNKVPSLASAQQANKVLEEICEEVVDYEPWMDNFGQDPAGVEFDQEDQLINMHPELWLQPEQIKELIKQQEEEQKQAEEAKQRAKESKKKKSTKKSKKKSSSSSAAADASALDDALGMSSGGGVKKGIASKKNIEPVDELTAAASSMLTSQNLMDDAINDDFFNLEDDDALNFEGIELGDLTLNLE